MLTLILPRVLSPNTLSKAAWQSGLLTPFLTSSCTIMFSKIMFAILLSGNFLVIFLHNNVG